MSLFLSISWCDKHTHTHPHMRVSTPVRAIIQTPATCHRLSSLSRVMRLILSHTHHLTYLIWKEHVVTLTDNSIHRDPWEPLTSFPKQVNTVLEQQYAPCVAPHRILCCWAEFQIALMPRFQNKQINKVSKTYFCSIFEIFSMLCDSEMVSITVCIRTKHSLGAHGRA